jgi:Lrp/AsnC family transcriptional regulator for asnA, asnC and gidA
MVDSLDEKLVLLMGQDALQSSDKLAKQLKVSSATVRRRLKRLQSSGLLRIIGVVDPNKFGFVLHVVIGLAIINGKEMRRVEETLINRPEVAWVSTTTGQFNIIAIARFPSTDSLSRFSKDILGQIEGLKSCEVFMCMEIQKGSASPLPLNKNSKA